MCIKDLSMFIVKLVLFLYFTLFEEMSSPHQIISEDVI